MKLSAPALMAALFWAACSPSRPPVDVHPALATAPVSHDPDDPAVWVHPSAPERSLILGTNKAPAPHGALVIFGLDGGIRQTIAGLHGPNNVDVEYGLSLGGQPADIAVVTERLKRRLRIFRVDPPSGLLSEVSSGGGPPVFEGEPGESGEPMGIALYRRPRDGVIFAILTRKTGPRAGYLWQYRLEEDGTGCVKATRVRAFGVFSGAGEIEAVAVDDALGYVYYADEGDGIHKWHADPDHPGAARELAHFARTGFSGDREGIGIYAREDGTGYVVCADQLPGSSTYYIYTRQGKPGAPHDHSEVLKGFRGGADSTDGIEVTSASLGSRFPNGLLVAMNSAGRNFLLYRWEDIAAFGRPQLQVGRR